MSKHNANTIRKNRIRVFDRFTGEQWYLIAFCLFLIADSLGTTVFNIPGSCYTLLKAFAVLLVAWKIVFYDRFSPGRFWIMILAFAIGAVIAVSSGYTDPLLWLVMLFGAKEVNWRKIVTLYFIISLTIVALAFAGSLLDVIRNLQYARVVGNIVDRSWKIRNSFGAVYTTDFASHVLGIMLSGFYLLKDRMRIWHYGISIATALFVYFFCYTRVDVICMFILMVLMFVVQVVQYYAERSRMSYQREKSGTILMLLMPFLAVVMFGLSFFYSASNKYLNYLNTFLSQRLELGRQGLLQYGSSLFGQDVPMFGYGGAVEMTHEYFFVDCSYLYVYLRYGVVFLLLVLAVYAMCCKKMAADPYYLVIIIVLAINCMIAHHLIVLAYNPFALVLFATVGESCALGSMRMQWKNRYKDMA